MTGPGSLTMLKLPGDEFVTLELVHDRARGPLESGGFSHLVDPGRRHPRNANAARVCRVRTEQPASPDGSTDFPTAWVTEPDGYRIELVQ